uniref:Parathyroid hormone n=1 Tax=Denticeps clupeoides TaxID=299321 RepID=A0AAY4D592_9TELE
MTSTEVLERILLVIFLCNICSTLHVRGQPLRKRSISEVQLMHNVGEHKQMLERQDWLQVKLKNILATSPNNLQKGQESVLRETEGKHLLFVYSM